MQHHQSLWRALIHVLTFSVLVAISLVSVRAGDPGDLSGTWTSNEELSDDPASILRDAANDGAGSSGGLLRRITRSVSVFGIPVGSLPLPSGSSAPSADEDEPTHAGYTLRAIRELKVLQDARATELDYGGTELVAYRHGEVAETDNARVLAEWSRLKNALNAPNLGEKTREQINAKLKDLAKALEDLKTTSALDLALRALDKNWWTKVLKVFVTLARPQLEGWELDLMQHEAHQGDYHLDLKTALVPLKQQLFRLKRGMNYIP